ncbi:MAG: RcpC/CpaB family pilus assembly protein [Bacteroidota bacterium]
MTDPPKNLFQAIPPEKRLLYLAVLLGTAAFLLNWVALSINSTKDQVVLLSARQAIRYGQAVGLEDFEEVTISAQSGLSRDYVRKSGFSSKEGQRAQKDMARGELLSAAALGERAMDFDPRDLREGERLVAINVGEESSLGYRLHMGDRIDIYPYVIMTDDAKPLLENVEVVTVGSETRSRSAGGGSYSIITLRLSETDAVQILKAQSSSSSRFRITLRHPG